MCVEMRTGFQYPAHLVLMYIKAYSVTSRFFVNIMVGFSEHFLEEDSNSFLQRLDLYCKLSMWYVKGSNRKRIIRTTSRISYIR